MSSAGKDMQGKAGGGPSITLLKKLRLGSAVLAVGSGLLLPIEHGSASAFNLSSLPVVGGFFPRPVGFISIQNYPFTAVVGHTERFSVQLQNQPNVPLVYELFYPDGHVEQAAGSTDANGFSSHTFRILGYRPTHFRETATIGVHGAGAASYQAYLHFAIQQGDAPAARVTSAITDPKAKSLRHANHVKLVHDLRLDRRVGRAGTGRIPWTKPAHP